MLDNVDQIWDNFSYYMEKEHFFRQIIWSPQIKLVVSGNIQDVVDIEYITSFQI